MSGIQSINGSILLISAKNQRKAKENPWVQKNSGIFLRFAAKMFSFENQGSNVGKIKGLADKTLDRCEHPFRGIEYHFQPAGQYAQQPRNRRFYGKSCCIFPAE